MGLINYIDIDWPDLFKPILTVKQNCFNRIRINREVIPIIFVPGIMGSRLKNTKTGANVWDPDREIMCMLLKYGGFWNTPAQRKRMLIGRKFDPDYLEVNDNDADHNGKFYSFLDPWRTDRGWGGVYWGSYGAFLQKLQDHRWDVPVKSTGVERTKEIVGKCFEFPVYAFGYNWTDSNDNSGRKLEKRISTIISKYKSAGRLCKYVILISHSMGGLVCRSACKLHDAEKNVLGVIHGVQPATGAASAYWRMKAGFERAGRGALPSSITAWVLGTSGEEVTCILGNAPGGLELLPNQYYTSNDGNPVWLRFRDKEGREFCLPQNQNPYEEVYKVKTQVFWRLINPEWLSPKDKKSPRYSLKRRKEAWNDYLRCLDIARAFHYNLHIYSHKNTYQFYSSCINTSDRICFSREPLSFEPNQADISSFSRIKRTTPSKQAFSKGTRVMFVDANDQETEWHGDQKSTTDVLTMSHPDDARGGGDGTVPESSANALKGVIHSRRLNSVEHQAAFCDPTAIDYIVRAVRNLGLKRIKEGEVASAR